MRIYGNLYEGLVRFDSRNNLKPSLAVSWGNPDDLTWEYKLRKGVKFHDGSSFSADDVITNYQERIKKNPTKIPAYLSNIKTIEKKNDFTILIKTNTPDPILNQKINSFLIAKENNIGTWPYAFASFDPKNGCLLNAFENYWGDLPVYRHALFETVKSKNTRITEFGKGNIDILTAVPVEHSVVFDKKIKTVPSLEANFLLFNQKSELWSNLRLRKLATKVIDKNVLTQIAGKYSKIVNQFVSPWVFGYSLNIQEKEYNPKSVKEEIAEIFDQEWINASLDLTSDYKKIGEYIQKEFRALNIKIELNFISPQKLVEKITNKDSEMFILGWQSESGDSGDFLNSFFLENAQLNSVFVQGSKESAKITKLIQETNQELNPQKRLHKLQNIMDILIDEDVVGLPLFESERIYAVNSNVNFEPRIDGMIVLNEIK